MRTSSRYGSTMSPIRLSILRCFAMSMFRRVTFDDVGTEVELSKVSVCDHVASLVKQGYLCSRTADVANGYQITDAGLAALAPAKPAVQLADRKLPLGTIDRTEAAIPQAVMV